MNPSGRYLLPLIPAMVVGLIALWLIGFPRSGNPETVGPQPAPDSMWVVVVIGAILVAYAVGVAALRDRRLDRRSWLTSYLVPVVPAALVALIALVSARWIVATDPVDPPRAGPTWIIVTFALFVLTYILGAVLLRRRYLASES